MLWTNYRGRLVGAVRESDGVCFVEGHVCRNTASADGDCSAAVTAGSVKVVRMADQSLAGAKLELVCMATVVDAAVAGESALLLLRSATAGVTRYVLLELFDSSYRLEPKVVLSFVVRTDEEGKDEQDLAKDEDNGNYHRYDDRESRSLALPVQPFSKTRPWMLDGPVVCIPCASGLIVAHLVLTNRRGEVSSISARVHLV